MAIVFSKNCCRLGSSISQEESEEEWRGAHEKKRRHVVNALSAASTLSHCWYIIRKIKPSVSKRALTPFKIADAVCE
jgi:hypothetical protein